MKLISKALMLFMLSDCASASIIYGVENINNRQQHVLKNPAYVQMGSFSKPNDAIMYQRYLRKKTNHTVFIRHSAGHYQVRVGPFNHDASLKHFAHGFSQDKPIKQPTVLRTSTFKTPSKFDSMKTQPVARAHAWPTNAQHSSSWFLSGQVGGQKTTLNSSTRVDNGSGYPPPNDQDIYTADHSNMAVLLGVQAGRRWETSNKWLSAISLGAQYQYFFASNVSGQVVQFALPQFTNYNYKWRTDSNVILGHAKLNFIDYKRFSPYVSAGVGAAFNTNGHYFEDALPVVTPRISPNYQAYSKSQLAYIFGTGIDFRFSPELIMSVGYQYSNLGQLGSGYGTDSWSAERLNLGHDQSNAFLLGLTYLFDFKTNTPYTK